MMLRVQNERINGALPEPREYSRPYGPRHALSGYPRTPS